MKIEDLSKFVKFLAQAAVKDCGIKINKAKINNYITLQNVEGIVRQYARIKNDQLYINRKILLKINNDLLSWVLGVSLAKAAANGELECYWDDIKNCMIFNGLRKDII